MRLVAFNGSARKDGNTATLLRAVLGPVEAAGIETELVQLAGKKVHGCTACGKCGELKTGQCEGVRDFVNECIDLMRDADGIVIGSPVYFADVSAETKALIDRAGYVGRRSPALLTRKVGAAVVAQRRAGALHALDSINHFFQISDMVVPGSSYWNLGMGGPVGAVDEDTEGLATMTRLGENLAWLLERLSG